MADTGRISLWDQVESELEARFAKALEDWAGEAGGAVLYRRAAVLNGHRTADLRISQPGGQLVHWQASLQNTIEGTRPDVSFQRVDAAPLEVDVYLDGYAYHAAPDKLRLASDADQRAQLRADGHVVFQLNWDDVDAAAGEAAGEHQPWHPYRGNAEAAARGTYARLGEDPAELPGLIWTSPVRTLFVFLSDPDRDAWSRRAQAAVAGLLRQPGAEIARGGEADVPGQVRRAVRGEPLAAVGGGPVTVVRAADASGCPVTVIVDARRLEPVTAPLGTWSALAVIDDREATARADAEAHERRWAAWLYWGNLVQFLDDGGGDGVQLARTGLDGFDPSALAAAGGAGLAASLLRTGPEISEAELSMLGALRPAPSPGVVADQQWSGVYDLVVPEVAGLLHTLADRGAPAPHAGWDARLPGDWPPDELGQQIAGGN